MISLLLERRLRAFSWLETIRRRCLSYWRLREWKSKPVIIGKRFFIFQKAYKENPNYRAAAYGLVESVLILDNGSIAKRVLDEYKFSGSTDYTHRLLAEAFNNLDMIVDSKMAMAEHYAATGDCTGHRAIASGESKPECD